MYARSTSKPRLFVVLPLSLSWAIGIACLLSFARDARAQIVWPGLGDHNPRAERLIERERLLRLDENLERSWVSPPWSRERGLSFRGSAEIGLALVAAHGGSFGDWAGGIGVASRIEGWPIHSPYVGLSLYADGMAGGAPLPLGLITFVSWFAAGEVGASAHVGIDSFALLGRVALGGRVGGFELSGVTGVVERSVFAWRYAYVRFTGGLRIRLHPYEGFDFLVHAERANGAWHWGGGIHYWLHNGVRIGLDVLPVVGPVGLTKVLDWFGPGIE